MPYFVPADVVERADGSLVCKTHGHVVCGICNVNYTSFTWVNVPLTGGDAEPNETLGRFEDSRLGQTQQPSSSDIPTPEGVLLASRFQPPQSTDTPNTLFSHGQTSGVARIQYGQGETRRVEFIRTAKHTRFV